MQEHRHREVERRTIQLFELLYVFVDDNDELFDTH